MFEKIKKITFFLILGISTNLLYAQDSTEIDFEAGTITGKRRLPLQSLIGGSKHRTKHSFLHIRKNWHDKIIASTLSLDYSKGTMGKRKKRKKIKK